MSMPVALSEVVTYLDDYLRVGEVPDASYALNGLQVENRGTVGRVAAAVDACQATIDAAADQSAGLLLVHHGLFWSGLEPLTGRHARRVRRLLEGDVALYAAHLPLDVHPEVGNNAVLARSLGLEDLSRFGDYRGEAIGVLGSADLSVSQLVGRLQEILGVDPHVIAAGPDRVARVGVITGGAGDMIRQAKDAGADTFLSGEGTHHTHFDAEEWGLNVIYAGHYATETVGVKALAQHLQNRFGLPWQFVDHPTGL
jgi:dinuclear metal center YbgI/SA1388 family protein